MRGVTREPEAKGVAVVGFDDDKDFGVDIEDLKSRVGSLRELVSCYEGKISTFSTQEQKIINALALLDSGATHAVVPFKNGLGALERVPVTLAGDSRQEWLRTRGGTLVVPPGNSSKDSSSPPQTILPLGSLVENLGCSIAWSRRNGLKVTHPTLGVLDTGVSPSHCPLLQEEQAMKIIHELEAKKLSDFEEKVQELECQIESVETVPDPTETIKRYVISGDRRDALQAILSQAYFEGLSERLKRQLAEGIDDTSEATGLQLLKALPMKRAARRTMMRTQKWMVHLCSGPGARDDPLSQWCETRGIAMLGIDLRAKGGKGWDLTKRNGVWRLLLWAAAAGRIAVLLSSPPKGPGLDKGVLSIQDMFLWSVASVAAGRGVPYLCTGVDHDSPSRKAFELWSGVRSFTCFQGALGGEYELPTTVMTNLSIDGIAALASRGKPGVPEKGHLWISDC